MKRNATLSIVAMRLAACAAIPIVLSGCVSGREVTPVGYGPAPVLVNPDYRSGAVHDTASQPIPSLEQLVSKVPVAPKAGGKTDLLRSPALREGALAYGAQGGLAWETRAINTMLNARADEFNRVYDFNRVLIESAGHAKMVPPVISEAEEAWETTDSGRTLRVADRVYDKVSEARFVPNAPVWQEYLLRAYVAPQPPANVLLPRDSAERKQWGEWVKEGWEMGREQANEIMKMDLARLDRDFNGMVRYKVLLEEGKVSAPVVADSNLGTTGSGDDMRVNDRAVTITKDPKFNVTQPSDWRATPTTPAPEGGVTGSDPARPRPAARPAKVASAPAPAAPVESRKAW